MNTTSAEKDDPDVRKEGFSRRGGHGEGPVELRCASTRRRLTPRQLEVLTRIRETGTAGAPEEGRRIDLTLSSLVRRRLVHRKTPVAKGEPIRYALSEEGERHFRSGHPCPGVEPSRHLPSISKCLRRKKSTTQAPGKIRTEAQGPCPDQGRRFEGPARVRHGGERGRRDGDPLRAGRSDQKGAGSHGLEPSRVGRGSGPGLRVQVERFSFVLRTSWA